MRSADLGHAVFDVHSPLESVNTPFIFKRNSLSFSFFFCARPWVIHYLAYFYGSQPAKRNLSNASYNIFMIGWNELRIAYSLHAADHAPTSTWNTVQLFVQNTYTDIGCQLIYIFLNLFTGGVQCYLCDNAVYVCIL